MIGEPTNIFDHDDEADAAGTAVEFSWTAPSKESARPLFRNKRFALNLMF